MIVWMMQEEESYNRDEDMTDEMIGWSIEQWFDGVCIFGGCVFLLFIFEPASREWYIPWQRTDNEG